MAYERRGFTEYKISYEPWQDYGGKWRLDGWVWCPKKHWWSRANGQWRFIGSFHTEEEAYQQMSKIVRDENPKVSHYNEGGFLKVQY